MGTNDVLGGFNHPLQSPPVPGHAQNMRSVGVEHDLPLKCNGLIWVVVMKPGLCVGNMCFSNQGEKINWNKNVSKFMGATGRRICMRRCHHGNRNSTHQTKIICSDCSLAHEKKNLSLSYLFLNYEAVQLIWWSWCTCMILASVGLYPRGWIMHLL